MSARSPERQAVVDAMLWAVANGAIFMLLNAILRTLALQLPPFETQFLRYLFGVAVLLPWALAGGIASCRPKSIPGQLWRGAVHSLGLLLWFAALPMIPLADGTAIGFTTPMFVMIGAAWMLRERMVGARWVAAIAAFGGVLIVVWPKLSGSGGYWNLVMLASQPLFAFSYILTKILTRADSVKIIILWQAMTVALCTAPFALAVWVTPTASQWLLFLTCGLLGSIGHYCMTRAVKGADLSATQSVRFLDLIWSATLGVLFFGDWPSEWTFVGGVVIVSATVWIARHESRHG